MAADELGVGRDIGEGLRDGLREKLLRDESNTDRTVEFGLGDFETDREDDLLVDLLEESSTDLTVEFGLGDLETDREIDLLEELLRDRDDDGLDLLDLDNREVFGLREDLEIREVFGLRDRRDELREYLEVSGRRDNLEVFGLLETSGLKEDLRVIFGLRDFFLDLSLSSVEFCPSSSSLVSSSLSRNPGSFRPAFAL